MTALSEQVLVLNRNYSAIEVTDAKRALCLMFKGVAEAVDVEQNKRFYNYDFKSWTELSEFKAEFEQDQHRWVRCVRDVIAIPEVIRLLGYAEYRRREPKMTRRNVFLRDKNICQYCGKRFKTSELSLDHIVPKSRGGKLTWDNIVCACVKCNTHKADRTPREAHMKLIKVPRAPKSQFGIPRMRFVSWKHFVDAAYWNTELIE